MSSAMDRAEEFVQENVGSADVVIFSKSDSQNCQKITAFLDGHRVNYMSVNIEDEDEVSAIEDYLQQLTGERTVPRVFIKGKSVGGCDETIKLHETGELMKMIQG